MNIVLAFLIVCLVVSLVLVFFAMMNSGDISTEERRRDDAQKWGAK